jgi:hypothetical protein
MVLIHVFNVLSRVLFIATFPSALRRHHSSHEKELKKLKQILLREVRVGVWCIVG